MLVTCNEKNKTTSSSVWRSLHAFCPSAPSPRSHASPLLHRRCSCRRIGSGRRNQHESPIIFLAAQLPATWKRWRERSTSEEKTCVAGEEKRLDTRCFEAKCFCREARSTSMCGDSQARHWNPCVSMTTISTGHTSLWNYISKQRNDRTPQRW